MSERIVIWLEGKGPVRIDPDKWPIIREGNWSGGLLAGMQRLHMEIREHDDGRLIVYGEQRSPIGEDSSIRTGRVAPRLRDHEKGLLDQAVAVGKTIGLSQVAVQDFVAPLLAVDLD